MEMIEIRQYRYLFKLILKQKEQRSSRAVAGKERLVMRDFVVVAGFKVRETKQCLYASVVLEQVRIDEP